MSEEEKNRIKHLIERCNECKLNACITCDICIKEYFIKLVEDK